jgi:hypothetical protein
MLQLAMPVLVSRFGYERFRYLVMNLRIKTKKQKNNF